MKIAFDYQIFFLQNYGGISRYFKLLAEELSLLEQDVKIFSGMNCNNYLPGLDKSLISGRKLSHYPKRTGRIIREINHFTQALKMSHWKPDIVHETYYSKRCTSTFGAVKVTTVYDMIHELFPMMFSVDDRTSEAKKVVFNRVDHIISISHSTKADLIRLFGIDEQKISVVHLGVDEAFARQPVIDMEFGKRPYLLYVGARQGYKNFEAMLQAICQDENLKADFDIVAFGGGVFSEVELGLITDLGFKPDQVKQISGDDCVLANLYKNAHAFIYPSLYEGFGLPPLEAMVCNCPVISSNTSSMPEVIGDAGEFFDPTNISSIRQAISNVVYSSLKRQQLIELGNERVKYFTWAKCAQETLAVYKRQVG